MREDLDAVAACEIETAVRAIMRRFGVSVLYVVDAEYSAGFRYWSFGQGHGLIVSPTKQPQSFAVVQDRVAQAA